MSFFTKLLPRFAQAHIIRGRARLEQTPLEQFKVRIARNVKDYEDAFTLLHIAYVFQGIESVREATMRITPQHVLPESTVFSCYEDDQIVGTMTVTLDSPAGLPLDKDYPDRVGQMRQRGDKLVEYGSLAVVRRHWHSGVTTLLNIAAHWWSRHILEATHCIIGVHPRAAPWYEAVYLFQPLGPPRQHAELTAPVQGLEQDLEETDSFMVKHFTKKLTNGIPVGIAFRDLNIPCIDIPRQLRPSDLVRWKLPREVFRELFINKSNHISSLDPETRAYLEEWRSPMTLEGTDPFRGTRSSELSIPPTSTGSGRAPTNH